MQKKTIFISVILIAVVLISAIFLLTQTPKQETINNSQLQNNISQPISVGVILDKNSYSNNEKVKITIQNNYNESIFIPGAFVVRDIYKKNGDKWIVLDTYCKAPYCMYKLPGPEELKPSESKNIEWVPVYFVKRNSKPLENGEYIISIYSRFDLDSEKGSDWKSAYSDKFIIQ